jgi:hypothetical protein
VPTQPLLCGYIIKWKSGFSKFGYSHGSTCAATPRLYSTTPSVGLSLHSRVAGWLSGPYSLACHQLAGVLTAQYGRVKSVHPTLLVGPVVMGCVMCGAMLTLIILTLVQRFGGGL